MKKLLKWIKNERKVVRKLICNLEDEVLSRKYIKASCSALLKVDARGKRSVENSGLAYPYTSHFTNTTEYKKIIFPWLNGEDFDLDNKRIIPSALDIHEEDL